MALRDERIKKGLTQVQLSERSGIDQTTISSLEADPDPNPKWYTARALKRTLGVPFNKLFRVTPPREARS